MVSGSIGAHKQHTHFIRDLARLAEADASQRTSASSKIKSGSDSSQRTELPGGEVLVEDDSEMIDKLEARNREVIAHEAAHMAAGGTYIKGGATYTYQIGPDGKPYAIGGEVGIDMSAVPGNPRATINKMMAIRAAALSPDEPSGQDVSVAAAAAQIEEQARAQLSQEGVQGSEQAMHAAAGLYAPSAPAEGSFVNSKA